MGGRIELSEELKKDMFVLDLKALEIYPLFINRISSSGDTVEDHIGRRFSTNSSKRKIFHSYKIALGELEYQRMVNKEDK